jgi:dephospho-CoA kinase
MRTIGITGGVGSGKSAVLAHLAEKERCLTVIADELAHRQMEPAGPCYRAVVDLLGQSVLDSAGQIDRVKMAQKIFADEAVRGQINSIVHPAVKEYILAMIASEREKGEIDFLFIEAALLIEDGYVKIVDELWYIFADEAVRQQRLMAKRGYSEEKARAIIASQLSESEYRAKCQVVIDNGGDLEQAMKQIDEAIARYKE